MSLPRSPKAVLFDMDGLLIDSETIYMDALALTAQDEGLDLPRSVCLQLVGHIWPVGAEMLKAHLGADFDTDGFRLRSTDRFYEITKAGAALKAGVLEILDRLDALSLPRAIVTSSRRPAVDHHIGAHGLLERFDAILAHGDYPQAKPAPDPYLTAASALGVDPADCLALEDSHNGVRAAAAAGMMTIMIPDLLHPTDEMHSLCVRIAADLHEVEALLR